MRLDARQRVHRGLTRGLHTRGDLAAQLAIGQTAASVGLGVDQRQHRLSLRQINAPVEKRAQRHLAGSGGARAQRQYRREDALENQRPAVRVDLDGVLACVAVRRAEEGYQHVVERFIRCRVDYGAIGEQMRDRLLSAPRRWPEQTPADGEGVRATHPHDADAAEARRGGDGGDGLT